jgi:hypothetical protein
MRGVRKPINSFSANVGFDTNCYGVSASMEGYRSFF